MAELPADLPFDISEAGHPAIAPTALDPGAVEIPHISQLFTIGRLGTAVVEQDSIEDIAACVYRTVVCPQGFREALPDFGVPSLAFATVPVPVAELRAAVERAEPRAALTTREEQEALNDAYRRVTLEVSG